jgi:dienelactone hydrolase
MLNSGVDSDWWWGAEAIKSNPDKYQQTLAPVEQRVLATVEWVVRKYAIDSNRIYLRGISMGGSGALGIGMSHGDVFAALRAGVPAGTEHALHRLSHSESLNDVPPVVVYFSQQDTWSRGMENWLAFAHANKLSVLAAWGPWGHLNHYEMTNPAVYEFPWLSIRKNEAYPAFTNTSADETYPGFKSDADDQNGQLNAYFRWAVQEDQPDRFAIELRLVQNSELEGSVDIPSEVTADVTLRRLQRFDIEKGKRYKWSIEQAGRSVSSGVIAPDDQQLLTIPRVKIFQREISLVFESD